MDRNKLESSMWVYFSAATRRFKLVVYPWRGNLNKSCMVARIPPEKLDRIIDVICRRLGVHPSNVEHCYDRQAEDLKKGHAP
jgi:hypothetical protein